MTIPKRPGLVSSTRMSRFFASSKGLKGNIVDNILDTQDGDINYISLQTENAFENVVGEIGGQFVQEEMS